eukprot:CAMPEP_0114250562 /NCGR_PEP_ID=MMETSP0058-20121206/14768_1 /TAXON_ID=36894 /ORGANISM="Pyramimonas parkeae, CCMP726" /LENGTH=212 /DNA_ID=CAMNT_0001364235 /DNA_START=192 /DNA_END=830 /DNA_ORIENTATION=+
MMKARLMCYLQGGRVDGMKRDMHGARDPSPPTDSEVCTVPHRLFFGRSSTTWGGGGVCFLDPCPCEEFPSKLRLWRVTLDQFNDIFAQENGYEPGDDGMEAVTETHLDEFRAAVPDRVHHDFLDSWYGGVLYLGDQSESSHALSEPILSFTLPSADLELFRKRQEQTNPPSEAYINVIKHGLVEAMCMDDADAVQYLDERIDAPLSGEVFLR